MRILEEVVHQNRKIFDEDHPEIIRSLDVLGECLGRMGKFDKAREILEDVLERTTRVLGEEHRDTYSTKKSLEYWTFKAQLNRSGMVSDPKD